MKKALSLSLSLSLSSVKSLQFNRTITALALACVMAVGSILPMFAVSQAQAITAEAAGRLYGWGQNNGGQLGDGTFSNRHSLVRLPSAPGGVTDWNELELIQGAHQTKALTPDGRLFVWGLNTDGALGLGHFDNVHTPVENTNLPTGVASWNDVEFIRGAHSTFVRTTDGRLFGWGRNEHGTLGFGHSDPVNIPTELTNLPTGVASWNDVEFIIGEFVGTMVSFMRTTDGRLFGWGNNSSGQLAVGHSNNVYTPTELTNLPPNVTSWNDVEVIPGWHHVFWRTSDGRLFATGPNSSGQLGLGHTNSIGNDFAENTNLPSNLSSWNDVEFMATMHHTRVLTSDGRLFVWGMNNGHLGLGHLDNPVHTPTENTNLPPGITSWNDVEFFVGSQQTYVRTEDGRLFGWGYGSNGRVGLGHTNPVYTPTELTNLPQGVRDWNDMDIFTDANAHIFARVRPLPPLPITKTLRLNEGTIVPGTDVLGAPAGTVSAPASFTFEFTPRQVQLNDDPVVMSRPVTDVPVITNQTITIDPSTATPPVNGVFTATGNTICIRALIYAHNPFPNAGVYVWELREIPDSSGLHNYPCVQVVYDTSRYQIRAHANSAGIIEVIEILEMEQVSGEWQIILPKLDAAPFTNTYTRLVGDEGLPLHNSLLITKEVEGMYADLTTQFNFTLTLTNPTLTPPVVGDGTTGPVIAQVVQSGTTTPVSPPRTLTIAPGANTFFLMHNESLLIPQLPAGTRFTVTEAANIQFEPEASVTAIHVAPATGTYPRQEPNTALQTGTYIIYQVNNNSADFINHHRHIDPTGLFITSTPWVALCAAALLVGLLATSRNRKRIEELPLVL